MQLPASPNFAFLGSHDELLVELGALAERYVFGDPSTALIKLRQLVELLVRRLAVQVGIECTAADSLVDTINLLWDRRVLTPDVAKLISGIRRTGNLAVHEVQGDRSEALYQLRMAHKIGAWFHRTVSRNPKIEVPVFVPPPDPTQADVQLRAELERLRGQVVASQKAVAQAKQTAAQEAELRTVAEQQAAAAYQELETALELAEETEQRSAEQRASFEQRLSELQSVVASAPIGDLALFPEHAVAASEAMDLDEADNRHQIDQQLRDNGWQADTKKLRYSAGTRPQKGQNLAIAEWPTANGPADYVLFVGLKPIAVVEAKRKNKDVAGVMPQAKRYSRGYSVDGEQIVPGGPWGELKIPFMFATNGRPFLRQLETKSGIWFLDGRVETNHPRVLEDWYTPEGLTKLLAQNIPAADERLKHEPTDYLDLRDYQVDAISAIEASLSEGKRASLVAMATGTGKTRTCIGLVYRLIKTQRFNRVLFLVDRTALGEQAGNAFKDLRLENLQTFNDIYDVKEIGDIQVEPDTRLHFATVQSLVQRLLYSDDPSSAPSIDQYDCIVIDECHRGYNLDREMTDAELSFRSEADYISKYRRVLDHFDAVKIGLTATPALHTTEIFGEPVYQYSYRQAVIDGYLVDHEPPIRIVTKLAEDGMPWVAGDELQTYDPRTGELELFRTPDDINLEVDSFNKRVVTENFNRVVCRELARHIDPSLPGKTMIFCATDAHADLVVKLLKEAFEEQYGEVEDDAVMKITGAADKPLQLVRNYKNERLPSVAVTVDLLTTGIDVPEIVNLVFIRRVRSRILYEQMMGRATRLCPGLHEGDDKEFFRIFDAVDLYSALEPYTAMKPVVTNPIISFEQLVREITEVTDESAREEIKDQIVAKLQRKKRTIKGDALDHFATAAGMTPAELVRDLRRKSAAEIAAYFEAHPKVVPLLDRVTQGGARLIISEHDDELRMVEHGYGTAEKPEDYLEGFRQFVENQINEIPALMVVKQRPRELTRQQLKELKLALDAAGYSEMSLRTAYRDMTNQDIAASIIGHIRHHSLGSPLIPYQQRVAAAMRKILGSRNWTAPQRKWLARIGKQLDVEVVVDRDALDRGEFKQSGGFHRLNKVFDGKMNEVLAEIADAVWSDAG